MRSPQRVLPSEACCPRAAPSLLARGGRGAVPGAGCRPPSPACPARWGRSPRAARPAAERLVWDRAAQPGGRAAERRQPQPGRRRSHTGSQTDTRTQTDTHTHTRGRTPRPRHAEHRRAEAARTARTGRPRAAPRDAHGRGPAPAPGPPGPGPRGSRSRSKAVPGGQEGGFPSRASRSPPPALSPQEAFASEAVLARIWHRESPSLRAKRLASS